MTILLADDEPDILESLRLALRIQGYTVRPFTGGKAVLEELDTNPPQAPFALVSDILMPGMSGLELIRIFKQRFPNQPAVAITGHGDKPMVMELLRSGCDDFLDKPFEPDELHDALQRSLALCREREGAIRQSLAADGNPRSAENVSDSLPSTRSQMRLRAIEALEREIVKALPSTAPVPPVLELPLHSFRIEVREQHATVALGGDCVGARSNELRQVCEELVTRGVRVMHFDLSGVEDMDALALGVLCSLSEELRAQGGALHLHHAASAVRLLFQHLGLECEATAQAA